MTDKALLSNEIYQQYMSSLVAGDRAACRNIVMSLLGQDIPLLELYTDLFQRSMYEVGERWERNLISVVTEHIATSITENVMAMSYPRLFAHPKTGKSAIVSCVANEYHQIGGRMVADYFEMQGWDSQFAGASQPLGDLVRFVRERQPDVVALSAAIHSSLPNLTEAVEAILDCSAKPRIIVGGQAFRSGGVSLFENFPRVTQLSTFTDLERYLKELRGER